MVGKKVLLVQFVYLRYGFLYKMHFYKTFVNFLTAKDELIHHAPSRRKYGTKLLL